MPADPTIPLPGTDSAVPAPKPEDLNYRKGDDAASCGTCQNYDAVMQFCNILQADTTADMYCDAWLPIENAPGAQQTMSADTAPTGGPDMEALINQIFKGTSDGQ